MSILYIDGFDHYAGLRANLLLGAYATVGSDILVTNTNSRTGGYSVGSTYTGSGSNANLARSFVAPQTTFGMAFGMYVPFAAAGNKTVCEFQESGGTVNATLVLTPSGAFRLYRGSFVGTQLLETNALFSFGAWNHIEFKVTFSQTVGTFEIRINEVTAPLSSGSGTGLDNCNTATVACGRVMFVPQTSSGTVIANSMLLDDLVAWNTDGSVNNDFIGDRRVIQLLTNGNEAAQDMTVTGAANAYTALQSADGDTSYLTASDAVPVTSEFSLENPSASVGAISAIQTVGLMRKTEAGSVSMQLSVIAGGDVSAGAAHSITDSYAYYTDVHETNPDTGAPWTPNALNSTTLRIRRTV